MSTEPEYVDSKLCKAFQATIEERLRGMDNALESDKIELQRRLHELNDLRSSFEHRLTVIETRAVTWTAAVGMCFAILQVVLRYLR